MNKVTKTQGAGWKRSPEELRSSFEVQRSALRSSCAAYDAGEKWEAIRLATSIHTLVHDQGKSYKSILTQMGVRASIRFLSSGRVPTKSAFGLFNPLVILQLNADATAEYKPKFENYHSEPPLRVQFHTWWEDELIFKDSNFTLTRKGLVFALRNKEGGGHLSDVIEDSGYVKLSRTSRSFVGRGLDLKPIMQAELASMRQLAWELTTTLEESTMAGI